ncbi:SOLUTE CARRIER FAMILY 17 [Salix viminalis]|uniref:SOLUTE CARRIER FAMILY 17 n=1 Tax=Salix viminalis TaxID=40686 RepID=A0A9Q0NJC7_SALVM|nr:SOLUTE CARRIER FAMILY 17 [Salix viminalis]
MNTSRALLYSFTDPTFRPLKSPPDISSPKRRPRERLNFRVRLHADHRCCVFRVSVRNSGRGETGKVYADVKSERYEIVDSVPESVKLEKDALEDVVLDSTMPWWEEFPKRWVIVILCFSAFLLCNMDRVNMSIAILPMSAENNWNPATVGLIQSSFFWGYLLTQIAGGIWADKVGGKKVLGFGVIWWSVATILTPVAAKVGLPFLLVVRAFMGIGEGVAMPAMNNILSKWVPVSERSRSLAFVYSGMYLGSVTGLAFSPFLIHQYGWPSVFYSFGSLGTVWFAAWLSKAHSSPHDDPQLRPAEKKLIFANSFSKEPVETIPWGLILSKAPCMGPNSVSLLSQLGHIYSFDMDANIL